MSKCGKCIELWLIDKINQHAKISEIDQIFGINSDDILINTVLLPATEVIYIKRKAVGPLSPLFSLHGVIG